MNRAFLFMAFFVCGNSVSLAQWFAADLLPIEAQSHFRTANPIGWTDGVTQRIQWGARAHFGPLHIRLAPQIAAYRSDRRADVLGGLESASRIRTFIQQELNRIDAPVRFYDSPMYRLLPGASYIRLQAFGIGASASTEALQWGPGVRHGLMFSGDYEGFEHLSLQTLRPLNLWIGSVEGMYMAGRLENSGVIPLVPESGATAVRPKFDEWRYVTGIVGSFEPRFTPGLKLGFARSFVAYNTILKSKSDYFPLFQPLTKNKFQDDDNPTGNDEWDQQLSAFFSWSFPSKGFRVYGELGRNDHSADLRDLIIHAEHSRAYVVGAEKRTDQWHTVVEITQLAMTKTQELRASPIWYTHHIVRHGITHRGQLLGPEIGPGSNSGFVSATRIYGSESKIGVSIERVLRQHDMYFRLFRTDPSRRWSDITTEIHASKPFGKLTLMGAVSLTKSFNIAFDSTDDPWDAGLKLGVKYGL